MIKNNRTCIVTREKHPKEELIRIVKTKDKEIHVNSDIPGRGIYIKKDVDFNIINKRKLLHKALRMSVNDKIYIELGQVLKEVQDGQKETKKK